MYTLTFISPKGITGFTEARDLSDAGNMISTYLSKGYILKDIQPQEPIALHDTCYVVQSEESIYTVTPVGTDEAGINRWFTRLANTIAFDDCSGERILLITYKGKELHYAGWKPGMRIEFENIEGNTIWAQEFPEWDH